VISIGNLSTGGSGKTPLAITLAALLVERGIHVDVLSRGYGRARTEPARVNLNGSADRYGDEPLLIARATGVPVYVAPQRYDAGLLAEADVQRDEPAGGPIAAAHILDDGFQHRQLHRSVDILLLNREDWQDSLLPAGNLREALPAARHASVIAVPADDAPLEAELHRWGWAGPVWRLRRHMQVPQIDGPAFAFCGIARPEQFLAGLENAGVKIAGQKAFRDHYDYTEHVVERLVEQARGVGARALLTTEKDAVRLGQLASAFPPDLPLTTASLQIEIEDAAVAIDWLVECLRTSPTVPAL
jgi:tetraacyldisaccharide 4'-kinase